MFRLEDGCAACIALTNSQAHACEAARRSKCFHAGAYIRFAVCFSDTQLRMHCCLASFADTQVSARHKPTSRATSLEEISNCAPYEVEVMKKLRVIEIGCRPKWIMRSTGPRSLLWNCSNDYHCRSRIRGGGGGGVGVVRAGVRAG